jgi:hypothetical protein
VEVSDRDENAGVIAGVVCASFAVLLAVTVEVIGMRMNMILGWCL